MPLPEVDIGRLRHTARLLHEDGLGPKGEKIRFPDFISLDPDDAAAFLNQRLGNLISGLSVLNREGPYGIYNRHDFAHVESAHRICHDLLGFHESLSGNKLTPAERNIATAIIYLHDIGNNIRRQGHGKISSGLSKIVFTDYGQDDPSFQSIIFGIEAHDEPLGIKIADFADISSLHPNIFPIPIFAAIAADKLDAGRHRLSDALAGKLPTSFDSIVEEVPHTTIMLYSKESNFYLSPDGYSATWEIQFSTAVDEEEDGDIKRVLEHFIWKDRDIYVPRKWHENWRDYDIPYSVSHLGTLRHLYCTRLAIMLSCLFALYPDLETFNICVIDQKAYINAKVMSSFHRDNWQDVLFMVWKKKYKEQYKEGLIDVPPILMKGKEHYEERKGYST